MSSKYNEPNLAEQTRITKVSTNTAENLLKAKLAVLKDRLNKRTEQIEEKRQEIDEMIQQEKRKNQENEDCDDFYEIIEKCKKGTCVVNKNKRNCCTDDDLNQLRKQLRKEYGDEQWTRKCIQNKKGGKKKTKRRRRRGGTKKKPNKKKTYKLKKKPPRRKPNRVYLTVHELPTIKECPVFVQIENNQPIVRTGSGTLFVFYQKQEDDNVEDHYGTSDCPDGLYYGSVDGLAGAGGRL